MKVDCSDASLESEQSSLQSLVEVIKHFEDNQTNLSTTVLLVRNKISLAIQKNAAQSVFIDIV